MPNTRSANAVRLELAPGSLAQTKMSGAALTGDDFHQLAGPTMVLSGGHTAVGNPLRRA
ncbi:MAG TPA: hypothetical protein VLR44_10940 [Rhodoferax sp.]|nr:hypothetical protein [Rhodoferax sp.]